MDFECLSVCRAVGAPGRNTRDKSRGSADGDEISYDATRSEDTLHVELRRLNAGSVDCQDLTGNPDYNPAS